MFGHTQEAVRSWGQNSDVWKCARSAVLLLNSSALHSAELDVLRCRGCGGGGGQWRLICDVNVRGNVNMLCT